MAARIRSKRNGILPIEDASRDDLIVSDVVTVEAIDAATTYSWAIAFAPEGSTAAFSGSTSAVSPGNFIVDLEGSYLIRLVVDATLPSETTQYVRLRALTAFGEIKLVAAGERRDETAVIPVDADVEGWANDQNFNLQTLKNFVKPLVASGRILYVDANDGTDNYADYPTVQEAIDFADTQIPSNAEQWVVAVRPGNYVGNIAFSPFVHVVGWPGDSDGQTSEVVLLSGLHTAPLGSGQTLLGNLHMENNTNTATAALTKTGVGTLRMFSCRVESNGNFATQGSAVDVQGGAFDAILCTFGGPTGGTAGRFAFTQSGQDTEVLLDNCKVLGPSGAYINPPSALNTGIVCRMYNCRIQVAHLSGVGVAGLPEDLVVDKTTIETLGGAGISINNTAVVYAGDVSLNVRFSTIDGQDIAFDTTNLSGTTSLFLGSVIYDALVFPGAAPTQTATTHSKTNFYDNTILGTLVAENVQDAIDELSGTIGIAPLVYHKNIPAIPNDTVRYRGWATVSSELIAVRIYMQSPHTVGTYELVVTNEATGNTVLAVDPTVLAPVAATVTPVALTAAPADLSFVALDRWTIALTSDDPGFDGSGIYVELLFNTASGGGVISDWATTLLVGNISGGTNPIITAGDIIEFGSSPAAVVAPASTGRIRYNQSTTVFEVSVDTGPWTAISAPDDHQFEMAVSPGNTIETYFFAPYDLTLVEINAYCESGALSALGGYLLSVEDSDLANNLLSAATFDMETTGSLPAATLTSVPLTGTVADLDMAKGTRVKTTLASNNADLVASGVYLQLIFRSQ